MKETTVRYEANCICADGYEHHVTEDTMGKLVDHIIDTFDSDVEVLKLRRHFSVLVALPADLGIAVLKEDFKKLEASEKSASQYRDEYEKARERVVRETGESIFQPLWEGEDVLVVGATARTAFGEMCTETDLLSLKIRGDVEESKRHTSDSLWVSSIRKKYFLDDPHTSYTLTVNGTRRNTVVGRKQLQEEITRIGSSCYLNELLVSRSCDLDPQALNQFISWHRQAVSAKGETK